MSSDRGVIANFTSPAPRVAGHALGAAIVVVNAAGNVLLVHHNYGRRNWEIPGGNCEAGESVAETALREAREELGVDARIEKLVGVYWEPRWRPDQGMHHFVFRASLEAELPPGPPDRREITEWGWFPLDHAPRPISDFTLRRAHDGVRLGECALMVVGERKWFE